MEVKPEGLVAQKKVLEDQLERAYALRELAYSYGVQEEISKANADVNWTLHCIRSIDFELRQIFEDAVSN